MSEININAVKEQLRQFTQSYQRPLRGKFAVLSPLREELLALVKKGASSADISAILAQYQITVSKDTVARFLREEARKERGGRARKSTNETQFPSSDNAVE